MGTGHDPFGSYLHRFNLAEHDECRFCGRKGKPLNICYSAAESYRRATEDLKELEVKAKIVVRKIYEISRMN